MPAPRLFCIGWCPHETDSGIPPRGRLPAPARRRGGGGGARRHPVRVDVWWPRHRQASAPCPARAGVRRRPARPAPPPRSPRTPVAPDRAGDGTASAPTGAPDQPGRDRNRRRDRDRRGDRNRAGDDGPTGGEDGGPVGPAVVASVPCADAEIAAERDRRTVAGIYGGVITLTLIVRNTADHACLRDVGSAPQELQVRQGSEWCGRRTTAARHRPRTYAPSGRTSSPASPGGGTPIGSPRTSVTCPRARCRPAPALYQVVARLGDKLSDPFPLEIRQPGAPLLGVEQGQHGPQASVAGPVFGAEDQSPCMPTAFAPPSRTGYRRPSTSRAGPPPVGAWPFEEDARIRLLHPDLIATTPPRRRGRPAPSIGPGAPAGPSRGR